MQLDKHQTSKPVMVRCEFNSHWRQPYFFAETFYDTLMPILYKNVRNVRFLLFTKTSYVTEVNCCNDKSSAKTKFAVHMVWEMNLL